MRFFKEINSSLKRFLKNISQYEIRFRHTDPYAQWRSLTKESDEDIMKRDKKSLEKDWQAVWDDFPIKAPIEKDVK